MRRQIRNGVFETNSSSVHTMTICTKKEFEGWENADLLYNTDTEKFITLAELSKYDEYEKEDIKTFDEYRNMFDYGMDVKEYKTESGDEITVFGGTYYG